MSRYIFIVGGVMSGVGKGVATASIGRILKDNGFGVTAVKVDPYINVDAGTMNPVEHGEVFVTEDGGETDQDLGNYERFLNADIPRENSMTTGLIYQTVVTKERNLDYRGKCVEVVPHIPEEIIRRIKKAGEDAKANFVLIEIGGTVGEYQNLLFLEAARMMKLRKPQEVIFVLVSYLPVPGNLGEMKTKPTQYAVRTLNSAGIQPDIILARALKPLDRPRKEKISIFCNMIPEDIISAPDVKNIYEIPINFEKENLSERILKKFGLKPKKKNGHAWRAFYARVRSVKHPVHIGIIGKYFQTGDYMLGDAYLSVIEAIRHAAWAKNLSPQIEWLDAETYEKSPSALKTLGHLDGLIVPGGFGNRGVEGKIKAIRYAREHNLPYFGLCYGMQLAVIEYARNICGLKNAHTTQVDPATKYPVIDTLPEQVELMKQKNFGGSMRLGGFNCRLKPNTLAYAAYKQNLISERHRHRYEVNNDFKETLESHG